MIKNTKKKFFLILLSALFFCFSFVCPSFTAYAEGQNYPVSYLVTVDENTCVAITLTDGTSATLTTFENNAFKDEIQANYTIDEEIITVVVNGEIYGVYDVSVKPTVTPENNAGNDEISNDSATGEQTPVTPENNENTDITQDIEDLLTEEQKEQVKGFIQDSYNKIKDKVVVGYVFLTSTAFGGIIMMACMLVLKKCKKDIDNKSALTEEQITALATAAATNVVKSIVGKSLNVDIQAEVSESVKEEIAPMIKSMKIVMQSAKNAEVGTALVMKAQAKSRLISDAETEELENRANSLLAHADKFGGLSVPIQINTKNADEQTVKTPDVNLVEDANKPVVKKENESYISF